MSELRQNRHEDRLTVQIPAKCIIQNDRRPATIDNVSRNGCRIANHVRKLAVGSRVMLKFEGMEPLSGEIKWSNLDFAGIEFEAPLHEFVLDRLFRMHGAG